MKKIYLIVFLTFNSLLLGTNNDDEISWNEVRKAMAFGFEYESTNPISEKLKKTFLAPTFAFLLTSLIKINCNNALKEMKSDGRKFNSKSRQYCLNNLFFLEELISLVKEDQICKKFRDSDEKIKMVLEIQRKIEIYKQLLRRD